MNKKLVLKILLVTFLFTGFCANLQAAFAPEDRFAQGVEAFKSGNYGSAELIFRKLADEDGFYRDRSWYYLALSIYYRGNYEAAIFEFQRFVLVCASPELATDSRFWIAESYYKLNNYIKAIEVYRRFISASKDNEMIAISYQHIGDIYFSQERYEEAIVEWQKTLQKSKNKKIYTDVSIQIGKAYFYNKDYDKAMDVLRPILNNISENYVQSETALIISQIYLEQKKYKDARNILKAVKPELRKVSPYSDYFYFNGLAYLKMGDLNSAKQNFNSFILFGAESNFFYDGQYQLGKIYLVEGKTSQGIDLLEKVRASTDKMILRSMAALEIAKIKLEEDPKSAITYLEDSLSLGSEAEQKKAMLILAGVYIDCSLYDDADRLLKFLLKKYPYAEDLDYIYFLIARVELGKGNIQNAIDYFRKVEDTNPFSQYLDESTFYLAKAYYLDGNYKRSISLLGKYLKTKNISHVYEANILLVNVYLEKGDIAKSEQTMKNILQRYSKNKKLITDLSEYMLKLEKRGRNISYFQNYILNYYPKSEQAGFIHKNRGLRYYESRKYSLAIKEFLEYGKIFPRDSEIETYLLKAYYANKNYHQLIVLMNANPELTKNKELHLLEGRSSYLLKDYKRAYELFYQRDLSLLATEDLYPLFVCSLKIEDLETAVKILNLFENSKNPKHAQTMYELGLFYFEKGDYQQAKTYFMSIIVEQPNSRYVDYSKMELGTIFMNKKRYKDAIKMFEQVTFKDLETRRDAQIILANIKLEKYKYAIKQVNSNFYSLVKQPYFEDVLREILRYYQKESKINDFNKLAKKTVKAFPSSVNYVNYQYGVMYFYLGRYKSAKYYFNLLYEKEKEYASEAAYYLGLISQYYYKRRKTAIFYYEKALSLDSIENITANVKLDLAIIYYEDGDLQSSRKLLLQLAESRYSVNYQKKAQNLLEYYGL